MTLLNDIFFCTVVNTVDNSKLSKFPTSFLQCSAGSGPVTWLYTGSRDFMTSENLVSQGKLWMSSTIDYALVFGEIFFPYFLLESVSALVVNLLDHRNFLDAGGYIVYTLQTFKVSDKPMVKKSRIIYPPTSPSAHKVGKNVSWVSCKNLPMQSTNWYLIACFFFRKLLKFLLENLRNSLMPRFRKISQMLGLRGNFQFAQVYMDKGGFRGGGGMGSYVPRTHPL